MSKLSFRARHLDPSKQMPIYLSEELPDLPEYSAINRAVPQMPSGMEKEEESEHHLQRAICTGLIIPTPEVYATDQSFYDTYYPANYKMPRQLIHMQPLGLDVDVPDYDIDSGDEEWLSQQSERLDLTALKFEQMMDRLEKNSGQTVVTLNEAKTLLNQDDEISISVYDYWLNKRLKTQHPLILTVKTENRPGTSSNNPYLAFRRRTEKMQTRKNRKNDETSYEKMLRLRRDLQRATIMLEMVKRREETKREQLQLSIDIFEKRVEMRDYSGAVYSDLYTQFKNSRPAFTPMYTNQYSHHSSSAASTPTGVIPGSLATTGSLITPSMLAAVNSAVSAQYLNSSNVAIDIVNSGSGSRKEKRQYKKRKHKLPRDKLQQQQYLSGVGSPNVPHHLLHLHRQSSSPAPIESNVETEEEDFASSSGQNGNKVGSESEDEAPYAFRRRQSCNYLRTRNNIGQWPWEATNNEHGVAGLKYRYTLTSINHPRPHCIGFARRRLGRGGRILFDRVSTNYDDLWSQLDYTVLESITKTKPFKKIPPKSISPPTVVDLPNVKSVESALPPSSASGNIEYGENPDAQNVSDSNSDNYKDDYNVDNDSELTEDENISRVTEYSSLPLLLHRAKRKKRKPNLKLNSLKRLKEDTDQQGRVKEEVLFKPLSVQLLQKLAKTLQQNDYGIIVPHHQEFMKSDPLGDINKTDDGKRNYNIEQKTQGTGEKRANHQHHRSNNNTVLNNNNNSSSNINRNVRNNLNVIKQDVATPSSLSPAAHNHTQQVTSATVTSGVNMVEVTIKQEFVDADDSNEPLISIRKSATTTPADLLEDEENVNLAQLSNIIKHTVKKELAEATAASEVTSLPESTVDMPDDADSKDDFSCLNQVEDVVRLHNIRNAARHMRKSKDIGTTGGNLILHINPDGVDKVDGQEIDYFGSLSPTSSQRFDICNELLSEIRRDWLHFRPRTPCDELSDSNDSKIFNVDQPFVNWSDETPITVEMNRLTEPTSTMEPLRSNADPFFLSNAFKFNEIESDAQFVHSFLGVTRGSSKSPDGGNSNSGIEFNLSGETLNDINLLGEGDDTDENMLDNILQECAMDDMKTLSQTSKFWNGILDGEAAVEDVANDVETADGLLDCLDDKKLKTEGESKRSTLDKCGHSQLGKKSIGSSKFTLSLSKETCSDKQKFFSKEPPSTEISKTDDSKESSENLLEPNPEESAISTVSLEPLSEIENIPAQQQQTQSLITPITKSKQAQLLLCTQQSQYQQPQHQQPKTIQIPAELVTTMSATNSVGDVVTIPPRTQNSLPQDQQAVVQQQLASVSLLQQQIHLKSAHLRNVTVQQRQQQPQQQQQQQQQQILLQMQRDVPQYVSVSNATSATVQQCTSNVRSQPTLTPISASTTGNHMIYATASGDLFAATTTGGNQKLAYTIQKSNIQSGNSAHVPSGLSANTVITLSNVKLPGDTNTQSANTTNQANVLTPVTVTNSVLSIPTSGVNIISSTAGSQHLAVHSIGGNGTGPTQQMIITPTTRTVNSQHVTQQQIVHNQGTSPQIVWRQVNTGGTNIVSGNTALITTTATETPTSMGSKIVWTNRPAQKRQINGPENTDIKLLMNRKFAQRKIIAQHQQLQQQIHPHHFQITKQQLQQMQQQQQQEQQQQQQDNQDILNAVNNDSITIAQETASGADVQQPQLQKLQMPKVVKVPQFPVLVSDINVQQQKQNSAAAIATANHNYSLQPTATIITSQASSPQAANKIFLTSSNSNSGAGNFAITTAGEFQVATSGQNSGTATAQKIHYKDLANSNLKLNFVSATSANTLSAQDNLINQQQQQQQQQQQPQTQQLGSTTVVLNKTGNTTTVQQQQQQKLKTLPVNAGAGNATITDTNNKRVLYTSLLNVKQLQKNNAGQMQMQIGPGALQHVLRGRLAHNPTIFTTNVRTLPLGTTVNSTSGAGNAVQVGASATIRQLLPTNNISTTTAVDIANVAKEQNNKGLTVEHVVNSSSNSCVVGVAVSCASSSSSSSGNNSSNASNNHNNNNNSNHNNNNSGDTMNTTATTAAAVAAAEVITTTTINR